MRKVRLGLSENVMRMRTSVNGRHGQLGGKTIISGRRGRTDRDWGCVRRPQYGDDEDNCFEDNYDDHDDDDDEIYLGAGRATSGVVLTKTGAGFLGSGGVAV